MSDVRYQRAVALRAAGRIYQEIADELDVSRATVYRWLNPEYANRQRAVSLAWKNRNHGVCVDCGGRSSLGNARHPGHSARCFDCRKAYAQREYLYWTRERAVAAAQLWASEQGRAPTAREWLHAHPERLHPSSRECYGQGALAKREGWRTWNEFLEASGLPTRRRGQRLAARVNAC